MAANRRIPASSVAAVQSTARSLRPWSAWFSHSNDLEFEVV